MVVFAFSIQDQVEKYGAYVGLAAFLGLAVLTVLYFAQARELKRLRDWAGRAPERAREVEAQAVANAEAARTVPAAAPEGSGTVGPAQPVAAPSGNGKPAGKPAPIPIGPRPAVAVAAAAARGVGLRHHARLHLGRALGRATRPIAQASQFARLGEVED